MKKTNVYVALAILFCFGCQSNTEKNNSPKPVEASNQTATAQVVAHYKGVLPCADCEGIETELQLLDNNTYVFSRTYLGKSKTTYSHTGTYHFDDSGAIATLEKLEKPNNFMYIDGHMAQLDMEGKLVTGDLASQYLLYPVEK